MSKTETNIHHAEVFGMPSKEFDRVVEILGRNPNLLELEIFSILWSEHASYKHSLKWLKLLPRSGSNVVVEAGRDISGAVDIGDDEVCVFKLESHNHPCAVQPRLGASTGLRAVTRDVFAMGALPLAFLVERASSFNTAWRNVAIGVAISLVFLNIRLAVIYSSPWDGPNWTWARYGHVLSKALFLEK